MLCRGCPPSRAFPIRIWCLLRSSFQYAAYMASWLKVWCGMKPTIGYVSSRTMWEGFHWVWFLQVLREVWALLSLPWVVGAKLTREIWVSPIPNNVATYPAPTHLAPKQKLPWETLLESPSSTQYSCSPAWLNSAGWGWPVDSSPSQILINAILDSYPCHSYLHLDISHLDFIIVS